MAIKYQWTVDTENTKLFALAQNKKIGIYLTIGIWNKQETALDISSKNWNLCKFNCVQIYWKKMTKFWWKKSKIYFTYMDRKIQYVWDVESSQLGVYIQCDSNINTNKLFYEY